MMRQKRAVRNLESKRRKAILEEILSNLLWRYYQDRPISFALDCGKEIMPEDVLGLTAQIVSAHVTKNSVSVEDLPGLIREVYKTLSSVGEAVVPVEAAKPAVAVTKSVFPDYIVCLEDGKQMTMLKRHLMTEHNLTVDQYRAKWGLPASYPMVAPNYAETRSTLAKKMGLGRSRTVAPPPKKAGRKPGRKAGARG